MAGVLKPEAAKLLIGAIRDRHPDTPIHVRTTFLKSHKFLHSFNS